MNVGDYVRTKNYGIKKILDIGEFVGIKQYLINQDGTYVIDNSIIKSSPNIIDLIEVGDYVNGKKVGRTIDTNELAITNTGLIYDISFNLLKEIDIKSIVTKEQFESMEYKVVE